MNRSGACRGSIFTRTHRGDSTVLTAGLHYIGLDWWCVCYNHIYPTNFWCFCDPPSLPTPLIQVVKKTQVYRDADSPYSMTIYSKKKKKKWQKVCLFHNANTINWISANTALKRPMVCVSTSVVWTYVKCLWKHFWRAQGFVRRLSRQQLICLLLLLLFFLLLIAVLEENTCNSRDAPLPPPHTHPTPMNNPSTANSLWRCTFVYIRVYRACNIVTLEGCQRAHTHPPGSLSNKGSSLLSLSTILFVF